MPIEVSCPSCAGQFRVPDTAAGKKIRCPKCKGAIDVPAASAPPPAAPEFVPPPPPAVAKSVPPRAKAAPKPSKPKPTVQQWFLKTEEGDDYGPVPRDELDAWYEEGRITADCQLLMEGSDQWQWAGDVFADLNEADSAIAAVTPTTARQNSAAKQPRKSAGEESSQPGTLSSRSRMVAGLLGIFLGPLGTHRFYLGYWVLGLVMLATAGGCGIWSLIDAVLVLMGKVPDADGRPLA